MNRTFFYSDPHFGHEKVIEMENRPFNSVHHMQEELVKRWNNTVSKGDTVYVLGDIALYMNKEQVEKVITRLKGKKILILGNHDRSKSVNWWLGVGFHTVVEHPILYKWKYLLSHEPLQLPNDHIIKNIHGHIHSEPPTSPDHFCVSVERIDYRPINLDKIKKYFSSSGQLEKIPRKE